MFTASGQPFTPQKPKPALISAQQHMDSSSTCCSVDLCPEQRTIVAFTPFSELSRAPLPSSGASTSVEGRLRRARSSPLERQHLYRNMAVAPLMSLQSRSSRHHWPGPNGDPIPENEPVRPSGAAQALLAPVRQVSHPCYSRAPFSARLDSSHADLMLTPLQQVHCAGDVSPRSSPSPTLYESLLSSPTASADELFDRQDSNTSTSDSLERCVRGGLPRLSSGLSSSMRSCYPRAKWV